MSVTRRDFHIFHRTFGDWVLSLAGVGNWLTRVRAAREARAATRLLLTHDDRLLSDIGVARADVEQALSVGWNQDPTEALAEIRRRRMQADRQGVLPRREALYRGERGWL